MSEQTAEVVQYAYDREGQSELTAEVRSYTYDRHGQRIAIRTRVFDPTVGRWVSQEPQAIDGGDAKSYHYPKQGPGAGTVQPPSAQ